MAKKITQKYVYFSFACSSGIPIAITSIQNPHRFKIIFVEAPNPLSISLAGIVSYKILGATHKRTPLANPKINLPRTITLKSKIRDNKDPTRPIQFI